MPEIRGLTVSVGYVDLLKITLPRNQRHLTETVVITSPDDGATQELACSIPNVRLHITDAFTRHNARFNKGLAIEEGFSVLGREGWILIWDADIMFPDEIPFDQLRPNRLHGARRRILEDPLKWSPDFDWRTCPVSRDGGPIGFWQCAHASDPAIKDKRPWYDVTFAHAGGGDAYFMEHWSAANRVVLPIDTLHLGPTDTHWFGTDQAGKDSMARFVRENGWHGAARKHTQESAARAPEIIERVQVPGYPISTYELPFVKRAQKMRDRKP